MRACRIDRNQPEIVKYFRDHGFTVLLIHTLKNCCDIIISKNNQTACIEIKDGLKPTSAQKLTPGEIKFKDEWQGLYYIVRSTDDADSVMKEFVMLDEYGNKLNLVEVK